MRYKTLTNYCLGIFRKNKLQIIQTKSEKVVRI